MVTEKNKSRTLWAGLIALVVIFLYALWPNFPLEAAMVESALGLLVAFSVAEGLEGWRPTENVWKTLRKSRKFWVVIAGLVVTVVVSFVPDFPITEELVLKGIDALMILIFGFGIEGAVTNLKA